ncbi:spz family protein [Megaselia abdita]
MKKYIASMISISVWYIAIALCSTAYLYGFVDGARGGNIVFPDQLQKQICVQKDEDSDFCLKVKDYPKRTIDNLLKEFTGFDLKAYFSDTTEEQDFIKEHGMAGETAFANRFGEDGEETLCHSVMDVLHPQAFQDKQGINRTIVNTDEYRQAVRVEKCKYPGNDRRCKLHENFPNRYTTECKQIFIKKKLMTLNDDSSKLVPVEFDIPSCCQCTYKVG